MEPLMQAHDRPARAAKQGFAVVKVKKNGRRSPPAPPDRGPEASKRRDAQAPGLGSDRTADPSVRHRSNSARMPLWCPEMGILLGDLHHPSFRGSQP
jgi:hypothetical protein